MTVGATEAIAATVLALVQPGDEVVTFEPYYDSYAATIALAGGVRRTSVLRFPDFAVDEASLRAAFSSRTRMVLLNTPHNPTGKVFTRAELELVCALAREHDAWVVTDEVYEHLAFDGAEHVPVSTLPGMRERTLTISSAGKTFSTTGWKVGWVSRAGRGRGGGAGGQAVPHVRRVGAVPAGGGRRARARRMPSTPGWRRRSRTSATGSSRGWAGPGWRCRCRAAPTSSSRMPRRSGAVDALAFCHELPGACRGGRGAGVGLPRRRRRGAHARAVRVLQARRRARRGLPPAGSAARLSCGLPRAR